MLPVTVEEVIDYLNYQNIEQQPDEEQVQQALEAEAAAQARKCRVDDPIQDDLREALFRRVARNLSLRNLPLVMRRGDTESGPVIPATNDPEVRRLEAPHRKLTMG